MNTQGNMTPGPWHVEMHQKIVWQDSGGPGNETYATQYPIWLIVHEQLGDPRLRTCVAQLDNSTESQANARAIAAMPDIIEALRACCKVAEDFARSPGDEDARQAASKACAALEKAGV